MMCGHLQAAAQLWKFCHIHGSGTKEFAQIRSIQEQLGGSHETAIRKVQTIASSGEGRG